MKKVTTEDANPMTWEEFDHLINNLIQDISAYFNKKGEKVHAISQLHRTGGIVGSTLAIKMKVIPLLPVQFKYSYNPTRIDQIITVPDFLVDLPEDMNIML